MESPDPTVSITQSQQGVFVTKIGLNREFWLAARPCTLAAAVFAGRVSGRAHPKP
jgi:hypothetical protein